MMESSLVDISVVIPIFNEEGNIDIIYNDLREALRSFETYELIFVDDGSYDNSFEKIKQLAKQNRSIKAISFSRNFGHQIAITAGLEVSKGEVVVTMDADGQHPASVISELFSKYEEGFDVVNTIRKYEERPGTFKRMSSSFFYFFINRFSDTTITPASADFRLLSRKAVLAFLRFKEKQRFTRGLVSWMGFEQATVEYNSPKRLSGDSKYSNKKMLRLAGDGITSFTSRPLRLSFYIGLVIALAGFFYAIYALVQYFVGNTVPGWTSLLIVVLILGGTQLISIGILGEYLARVFSEVKNRPLYLVKESIGVDPNEQQ
jgi:polyisoprenyl-phosphate glycosyltransferase